MKNKRPMSFSHHQCRHAGLAALAGVLLLSGCIYYGPPPRRRAVVVAGPYPVGSAVVVTQPPPAPIAETIPISPGAAYVWIPGVWIWQGQWVWTPGHWELPPYPGAVWLPSHYEYRNGVNVFVRGGWH